MILSFLLDESNKRISLADQNRKISPLLSSTKKIENAV